jgi:hypothetical protein
MIGYATAELQIRVNSGGGDHTMEDIGDAHESDHVNETGAHAAPRCGNRFLVSSCRLMAMSAEHKAALARGRAESRAIKGYLNALASRKPGRPVTKESLQKRLENVNGKLDDSSDPLERVELIQSRLDIEKALSEVTSGDDLESLQKGFVEHAKSYSERKGVSYTAWRELGVPAKVLREAGIKETRRR